MQSPVLIDQSIKIKKNVYVASGIETRDNQPVPEYNLPTSDRVVQCRTLALRVYVNSQYTVRIWRTRQWKIQSSGISKKYTYELPYRWSNEVATAD